MSKTHWLSEQVLNHFYRNGSVSSPATIYAGLLTAVTDMESGTGFTETTYGSYARQAVTFGGPVAGGNGRQISNTGTVSFPSKSDAGSVSLIACGLFDASSNGNCLNIIFLDTLEPLVFVCEDTTADTFKHGAHGWSNDQRVRAEAIPGSGGLPTGLSENTEYWVVNSAANNLQLSTSQGGGAVAITGEGECILHPYTPVTVNQNDTPEFAAAALVIYED